MRILCLTDFPIRPPDRWLWSYLPHAQDEVTFLSAEAPDRSAAWGKMLTRYPAYSRLAFRALAELNRQPYDLVVAWEASVGIPFALAARTRRTRRPPLLILVFNPGDVPTLLKPCVDLGTRTVDHMTVQTRAEAAAYARRFGVAGESITITPLPAYDILDEVRSTSGTHPFGGTPYLHASGRSGRDYATLLAAVGGLNIKVVVHGRGYNFSGLKIPPNVEIGELAGREEFHRLVCHALFEIVPLQPRLRPIGSSQVVFSMMMEKPVVVSAVTSLTEIVEDGKSGLLVPPADPSALRHAIVRLLEDPAETARMGAAARRRFEERHSFDAFARDAHAIMRRLVEAPRSPVV